MPDYSLFLSYASGDRIQSPVERQSKTTSRKDLIRVFFDDLDREMRGLGYIDGGFFDKLRLEAKWESELEHALASSRVLIPLYSRNYFLSRYCGKEWETFNQRFEENTSNRYPDVTGSKVILPVFWKAPVTFPRAVGEYQIEFEDYPGEYKTNGLEYLMSFRRNSTAYGKFLWTFSRKLLALAESQGAAKVRDVRDFDTLVPPFPGVNTPGLKVVRYVFVTGMKHQMQAMPTWRQSCDCYPNFVDRRDWRPCFPYEDRVVEGIATGPAKAESRVPVVLPPSPELMGQLREARRLNNVIVIVVDPWSLRLAELQQFLRDFDAEEFPNSAVLVNWNNNDPETVAKTDQLKTLLQDFFRGRIGRKEFHKDPVSSPESIERAILESFSTVQARLIQLGKIRPAGEATAEPAPVIRNELRP